MGSLDGRVAIVTCAGRRGMVQRVAPWSLDPEWRLLNDGRWTEDGLAAAVDPSRQPARGIVVHDSFVPGLLFELRHKFQHNGLHGAGGEDFDLSGSRRRDAGNCE